MGGASSSSNNKHSGTDPCACSREPQLVVAIAERPLRRSSLAPAAGPMATCDPCLDTTERLVRGVLGERDFVRGRRRPAQGVQEVDGGRRRPAKAGTSRWRPTEAGGGGKRSAEAGEVGQRPAKAVASERRFIGESAGASPSTARGSSESLLRDGRPGIIFWKGPLTALALHDHCAALELHCRRRSNDTEFGPNRPKCRTMSANTNQA